MMRPVAALPRTVAANLVGVFTDIDDTLTSEGRLPGSAYAALERLAQAGLAVVPVTGRPAGWCDMVARFWPVAGVVGENGAFAFSYDHGRRRMHRRFVKSASVRAADRARLDALGQEILAAVPGSAIASDQRYREADLAIDVCEDVAALPPHEIDHVVALFEAAGATAKVSSIHVNGWFGDYDKLGMTRLFAAEHLGCDLDRDEARFVFCGDSPNDAPMFAFFSHACGVANVNDFATRAFARPAYVTTARGGDGFVELAELILASRASAPDRT